MTILKIVEVSRDRAKTLDELVHTVLSFFKDVTEYEEKGVRKHFSKENAVKLLTLGADALENWITSPMTRQKRPLETLRRT